MRPLLIIACGALARELNWLLATNSLQGIDLTCLPADLHNTPQHIPTAMQRKILDNRDKYERIIAAYGDCGTGGALDDVLSAYNVPRIPGPHCYAFYSGEKVFHDLHEAEIGSFYLTDYLVRHFDRLVISGLGLDRHPQLRDQYFGHYRRLVYLAQLEDAELKAKAKEAARKLELDFSYHVTGFGELESFLIDHAPGGPAIGGRDPRILA